MIRRIFFLVSVLSLAGCKSTCPVGSDCTRSCPPGTVSRCAPEDLCICTGAQFSESQDPRKAGCRPPEMGDLIITEVLVDGDPTEKEEFIELVNAASEPIDMDGVVILSERGGRFRKHVLFAHGCLASKVAIAMYSDMDRWVWLPELDTTVVAVTSTFGFANARDVRLVLESGTGVILDDLTIPEGMIREGVSMGRSEPILDAPMELHSHFAQGRRRSPGRCPLGGTYNERCISSDPVDHCSPPEPGQLVINEVLIDGEPDATEEFVEVVNTSGTPIRLGGLELLSNRGADLTLRVRFFSGCLSEAGMVAIYADPARWLWSSSERHTPQFELNRFGFANSADFHFVLRTVRGDLIDEFRGERELIEPGVSINRDPDIYGRELAVHTSLSRAPASPSQPLSGHGSEEGVTDTDSGQPRSSEDAGTGTVESNDQSEQRPTSGRDGTVPDAQWVSGDAAT